MFFIGTQCMYVGLCVYVYVDFSANPTWLDIVHDADSFPTDLTADTDSGRLLSHFRHYQRYVQNLYFCVVVNVRGPRGSVPCMPRLRPSCSNLGLSLHNAGPTQFSLLHSSQQY